MSDITIRPIDYARDVPTLGTFLPERDRVRLAHCEVAVRDGECFILVADEGGDAVGWVVVHTRYRTDQDWDPDPDTERFQQGDNAYVEFIEVTARARSRGIGRQLLEAAQNEARSRGKRCLYLHTRENNAMAHRLFEREGWVHESTVYPKWLQSAKTRIYKKEL
jgi:ribosomal protein S18 acetylase RimI-like enzyme